MELRIKGRDSWRRVPTAPHPLFPRPRRPSKALPACRAAALLPPAQPPRRRFRCRWPGGPTPAGAIASRSGSSAAAAVGRVRRRRRCRPIRGLFCGRSPMPSPIGPRVAPASSSASSMRRRPLIRRGRSGLMSPPTGASPGLTATSSSSKPATSSFLPPPRPSAPSTSRRPSKLGSRSSARSRWRSIRPGCGASARRSSSPPRRRSTSSPDSAGVIRPANATSTTASTTGRSARCGPSTPPTTPPVSEARCRGSRGGAISSSTSVIGSTTPGSPATTSPNRRSIPSTRSPGR